jgi:N utilization substance protein B
MDHEFDIEKLISDYIDMPYASIDLFIKESVIKSLVNRNAIVNELQANMTNWKFDRINRLAQAILILPVTHYRYVEQIDKRIVIDNAVRLAKKYLDDGDYRLINAVLDATL